MPDRYPERGQRLVSTAMIPPPADGPPAPPTPAEPADTTCRAQYDPGPNPMPHTRIVRCDLPSGHAGDHAELIDGEIGATWDVPDRLNAEDCRGCTGVPMGYPYVCPGGAGHGPRPVDTAPADDVPAEVWRGAGRAAAIARGVSAASLDDPADDFADIAERVLRDDRSASAAVDYAWHAARAPLLAELDRHYQEIVKVTGRMIAAHAAQAEAERARDEARAAEERFRAGLAADGFTAVVTDEWLTLLAEVEGLRAAALPEGVEPVTEYVVVKAGEVVMLVGAYDSIEEATADLHLYPGERVTTRKAWYGAPEPVDGTEETGG